MSNIFQRSHEYKPASYVMVPFLVSLLLILGGIMIRRSEATTVSGYLGAPMPVSGYLIVSGGCLMMIAIVVRFCRKRVSA